MTRGTSTYPGSYRSAIARCRRILKAAGIPLYKITGRYSPFANTQTLTYGANVHRIGVSNTIAIVAYAGRHRDGAEARERKDYEQRALAALRAAGLPFDDRGWMDCGTYRNEW